MYNIKIAFRNLIYNGKYSIINIIGLAISMTVSILIMFWVEDEMSFDRFHQKGKNIYQTVVSFELGGNINSHKASSNPLGPHAKEKFSEIENFCRASNITNVIFRYEGNEMPQYKRTFVDTSFFSIFSFSIVEGNPYKPFTDNNFLTKSYILLVDDILSFSFTE